MVHCLLPTIHHNDVFLTVAYFVALFVSACNLKGRLLLEFTKTFHIMLRFTRIVRPGPSFFSPIIGRIPRKSVNSFLFVCSRRCKNSSPAFPLAYKSTSANASAL